MRRGDARAEIAGRVVEGLVVAGAIGLLALAASGAGCAPVPLGDGPRRIALGQLVEAVVLPTYADVAARSTELQAAVGTLTAAPAADTLATARDAWRAVRVPWKQSEAFGFGPVDQDRLGVALDQSPVDATKIDEELAGTATLDQAYVDTLGANGKGLHAIEYLLFDVAAPGDALAAMAGDDDAAVRRRAFLNALAADAASTAERIRAAWAADGGDYGTRFAKPGTADAAYATAQAALDAVVNQSVFLAETIADAKLGKPLGLSSGGIPAPELQESGPSDNSLDDIANDLRGIRATYLGTRDAAAGANTASAARVGLSALVAARSPVIDLDTRTALDAALAAVDVIPRPFADALVNHADLVDAAYDRAKELKVVLGTEVLGALGATLKFNANDGD